MQPARRQKTARQALASLMRLASRAEKSSGDARRLMRGWGIGAAETEKILAELIDSRFIDDQRFAIAYTREKLRTSGWGPRKIAAALAAKGVARETIDRTVREQFALAEQAEQLALVDLAEQARPAEPADRNDQTGRENRENRENRANTTGLVGTISESAPPDSETDPFDPEADTSETEAAPGSRLEKYLYRRLPRIKATTSYELRSKLTRYALSLGYDYDEIVAAVDKIIAMTRKKY